MGQRPAACSFWTRVSHALGIVEFGEQRKVFRPDPRMIDGARSADVEDASHELLPDLVLAHLLFEAEQFLYLLGDTAALAPLVQHPGHAFLAGDMPTAEIGHHDVAVSFEQRHECLHLAEDAALFFGGDEGDETALVERVLAPADGLHRVGKGAGEGARIGVDELEHLLDEREEVLAHPRNPDELGTVGHFVDRDPQPEVAGPERVTFLQAEYVGTDVIDRLAAIVGDEQVVLAEHTLRDIAEQRAHLGRGDPPTDRRQRVVRHLLAETLHQRVEEVAHRREIGVDPFPSVEHDRAHVSRRVKAGVRGDQLLSNDGQRAEVGIQRRPEIGRDERIASRDDARDGSGGAPIDRVRSPGRCAALSHCAGDPWSGVVRPSSSTRRTTRSGCHRARS